MWHVHLGLTKPSFSLTLSLSLSLSTHVPGGVGIRRRFDTRSTGLTIIFIVVVRRRRIRSFFLGHSESRRLQDLRIQRHDVDGELPNLDRRLDRALLDGILACPPFACKTGPACRPS